MTQAVVTTGRIAAGFSKAALLGSKRSTLAVEGSLLRASEQMRSFSAEAKQEPRKKTVMFVCKRNSCRSQMAEGWAKHIAKNDIEIRSSGLEGSRVHPTAKAVMQEVGVDITDHTSDFLHNFTPREFDAVISMCGCGTSLPEPWQKAELFEDWHLDDPDGKPLETFRRVRSEIKDHVEALVGKIERGKRTTQAERDSMSSGNSDC